MVSEISIAIIVSVCDLNIVGRGVFSSNLKFLLLILLYYPCRVFFWLGRWGGVGSENNQSLPIKSVPGICG